MTADVPDTFRDQLAKALPESLGPISLRRPSPPMLDPDKVTRGYGDEILDALLPVIAAEIARAQAAGEQRAAEVHRVIGSQERWARETRLSSGAKSAALGVLAEIRAALAQPAPGGGGQQ